MTFSKLLCRVLGHRRDRRRVWNDSLDFRSRCVRCGTEMVRDLHGWREFDPEKDADPRRTTHREHNGGT
ncbi:MAG: hypothetical protein ACXWJC_08685 [Croceibacterium sp.]